MKVVRDSKFRHVFGEPSKSTYQDIRLSTKATETAGVRINSKYLALPWQSGGGGTLAVIPSTRLGRLPHDIPLITGHTGPILDFEFSPFNESLILTASEDLSMKLWQVPEDGLKSHMKESLAEYTGHGKKVMFSTFNPCVENCAASASFDAAVKIWNLAEQAEIYNVQMDDHPWSLQWNNLGNMLASSTKDKKLRIIDPRAAKIVSENGIHAGVKPSKICWLNEFTILTTGFSQQAERQVGVWDLRTFTSSPAEDVEGLTNFVLDQGTGSLYPTYDEGTKMLYIAGKGDANVRFFEVTADDPYLHFLSQYSSTSPQKGFDFVPKRCVDTTVHEVMRGYKVEASQVLPISFRVPRKAEVFQEDLFPDAPAGVPSMTVDEFAAGTDPRPPVLRSMRPGAGGPAVGGGSSAPAVVSMKDLKKQLADALAKNEILEKENTELKAELAKLKA